MPLQSKSYTRSYTRMSLHPPYKKKNERPSWREIRSARTSNSSKIPIHPHYHTRKAWNLHQPTKFRIRTIPSHPSQMLLWTRSATMCTSHKAHQEFSKSNIRKWLSQAVMVSTPSEKNLAHNVYTRSIALLHCKSTVNNTCPPVKNVGTIPREFLYKLCG